MEIAVDTGPTPPELVWDYYCFGPVCEHLVFLSMRRLVEVTDREWVRIDPERSARWFFDPAEALEELPADEPPTPLMDYVDRWTRGLLSPSVEPQIDDYAIEGGTDLAGGYRGVEVADGVWEANILDRFAVFAPAPDTLAAEVEYQAGVG